jgi:hypothetical protein
VRRIRDQIFGPRQLRNCWSSVLIVALTSCGPDTAPEPPASKLYQDASRAEVPSDTDDVLDEGTPAVSPGGSEGDPNGGGAILPETERVALLKSCGLSDAQNTDTQTWQLNMRLAPTTRRGTEPLLGGLIPVAWSATLGGSWTQNGSSKQLVSRLQLDVQSSDSAAGRRNAEEQIGSRPGTVVATLVEFEERLKMATESPSWKDIVCTVQAASRLVHETSAGRVVTEFSPPLPLSIFALAEASQFTKELAAERSWTEISARVVESTVESVPVGRTFTGRVSVRPTTPTVVLPGGRSVTAPAAWEMISSFGTPAQTRAMGVRPMARWYVDHTAKSFPAVVIQTQEGANGEFTFER